MTERAGFVWRAEAGEVTGPLRGVKILDLTTVVMGPFATQILADMGADVIKVESPGGDSMRWVGPWRHAGMGPLFLQANRNKRSVLIDLKTPEGKARALGLASQADALVSNVRPQGLARLELDYENVRTVNPSLLYCSAVGYGEGGPESGKAVYDDLMQAASGISGLFRKIDGAPRYAPVNICDRTVGLYLANAITAGLFHRAKTGEGQFVEVPMFETMAQFVLADHMGGRAFEPPAGPMSYGRLLSTTRGPYRTKDGDLAVVVYVDRHWRLFSQMVGDPDLLERDARFRTMEDRTQNAEAMGAYLARHLASRTNGEWLEAFLAADIPACPVNAVEDLFDHPHLKAVGLFEQAEHPTEGALTICRFPVRFSKTKASVRRLAPNLGEHTDEIFGDEPYESLAASR